MIFAHCARKERVVWWPPKHVQLWMRDVVFFCRRDQGNQLQWKCLSSLAISWSETPRFFTFTALNCAQWTVGQIFLFSKKSLMSLFEFYQIWSISDHLGAYFWATRPGSIFESFFSSSFLSSFFVNLRLFLFLKEKMRFRGQKLFFIYCS